MSGIATNSPSNATPTAERPHRLGKALAMGCRYLLAVVLLMAAVTKITDLGAFVNRTVLQAPLPADLARILAYFLPWLELTCGACLLLGKAVREAALLAILLLIVFLAYGLVTFGEGDCGCLLFPGSERLTEPWWPLVRNFLLLLAAVPVVWKR